MNIHEHYVIIEPPIDVESIVIKQHLSMVEAVTGFDKRNRYKIWNGKSGDLLFKAEEGEIGCCTRNFFAV